MASRQELIREMARVRNAQGTSATDPRGLKAAKSKRMAELEDEMARLNWLSGLEKAFSQERAGTAADWAKVIGEAGQMSVGFDPATQNAIARAMEGAGQGGMTDLDPLVAQELESIMTGRKQAIPGGVTYAAAQAAGAPFMGEINYQQAAMRDKFAGRGFTAGGPGETAVRKMRSNLLWQKGQLQNQIHIAAMQENARARQAATAQGAALAASQGQRALQSQAMMESAARLGLTGAGLQTQQEQARLGAMMQGMNARTGYLAGTPIAGPGGGVASAFTGGSSGGGRNWSKAQTYVPRFDFKPQQMTRRM